MHCMIAYVMQPTYSSEQKKFPFRFRFWLIVRHFAFAFRAILIAYTAASVLQLFVTSVSANMQQAFCKCFTEPFNWKRKWKRELFLSATVSTVDKWPPLDLSILGGSILMKWWVKKLVDQTGYRCCSALLGNCSNIGRSYSPPLIYRLHVSSQPCWAVSNSMHLALPKLTTTLVLY